MDIHFFQDQFGFEVDSIEDIPYGFPLDPDYKPSAYTDCGQTYININKCKSFKQGLVNGILTPLSGQICSEVVFVNRTGVDVEVYDGGLEDEAHSFLLLNNESATFRGLTNSCQVSAKAIGGAGDVYYRTQYYSNNPSK